MFWMTFWDNQLLLVYAGKVKKRCMWILKIFKLLPLVLDWSLWIVVVNPEEHFKDCVHVCIQAVLTVLV